MPNARAAGQARRRPAKEPAPPDVPSTRPAEVAAADRRLQAVELRKAGASYRQIAQLLGVSHTQARKDVVFALKLAYRHLSRRAAALIALEYERLEMPVARLAKIITTGPGVLDSGASYYRALEEWRRLSESRRRLLGLDAQRRVAGDGAEPDEEEETFDVIEIGVSRRSLPPAPDGD